MVGVLGDQVEVVQDGRDAGALLCKGAGRVEHAVLVREVEAGGRLIQQQVAMPIGGLATCSRFGVARGSNHECRASKF